MMASPVTLRVPETVSASCVLVAVGFAATVVFTVSVEAVVVCAFAAGAARTAHARAAPATEVRMRVRFISFSREVESVLVMSVTRLLRHAAVVGGADARGRLDVGLVGGDEADAGER